MKILFKYDTKEVGRLGNLISSMGAQAPIGISRAINHVAQKARTRMIRALVPQTGLRADTLRRALRLHLSMPDMLYAVILSRGGDISLKYFKPREIRGGTSAAPHSVRKKFAGGFIKGGYFPTSRVHLNLGGHVFRRTGETRAAYKIRRPKESRSELPPIEKIKSGVIIPEEMIKGDSKAVFLGVIEKELPARIAHELYRMK